jgi:hypothetical protein
LIGYLPRKGRSHLTSVFELLGRLTVAHERDFCHLVRADAQRLPWGATLVVVTSRESEELLQTVLPLRRSGFYIVLVYLDYPNPASYELVQRRASMLGLRSYRIWREQDLDVWRRQAVQGGTHVHGAV